MMRSTELFRRETGPGETGRALVVMPDDEPDREAVTHVVERMGFQIESHRDAGTALEAVEYDRPDLVVHSFELPDMDGATFHTAVQKRAGGRRIPTLAIMPADLTPDQHFGAQTGIMEYICRPFQEEALRSRLGGLLMHVSPSADRPERKEHEMAQTSAPAPPANRSEPPRGKPRPAATTQSGLRIVGLGDWGIRGAEILADKGLAARAVDLDAALERVGIDPSRRHRIEVPGGTEDWAAMARAVASDGALGEGLREDGAADLLVLTANVGVGAGALLATLIRRAAEVAPSAARLAIARIPGTRSAPDERALALVALNAVLKAPQTSVLLVQTPEGPGADADPQTPIRRLGEMWRLVSEGAGQALRTVRASALAKALSTPGFIGWREIELEREDCLAKAGDWFGKMADEPAGWQPRGFDWAAAQAVLPVVRAPGAWLDEGGREQFERLVQAAWDEAAPCSLAQALYAGEQPARAILVSAGMPYPKEILTLRDSVQADRERLAEKRKAAETLIPLAEDFLPEGMDVLAEAPAGEPERIEVAPEPEPEPEPEPVVVAPEPEPEPEPEPVVEAPEPEPEPEPVVEAPEPEPEPEPVVEAPEPEPVLEEEAETAVEAPPSVEAIELPEIEAGPMPAAYETALGLVRRILGASDLRAEADLGEVRYALYDLLEILREEPEELLPEVFRPEKDEWFERHHVNVAVLAILTGDLLKGSLSEVIDLGTAALLHDVGMMSTRETWDVPMKLPPKVFERAIRPHPEEGFRMLQDIPGMTAPIARMVLEEHERLDGTGYPEGLAGDAIDPGARILAVCDTLEALCHPRPHRDHVSPGEALGRLRILGEYTLDASIVNALVDELSGLLRRSGGAGETI